MRFETFQPAKPLREFVDHFWFVFSTDLSFPRQTLFPDGGVTILFNLGDPHARIQRSTGRRDRYTKAWIAGERQAPYLLESEGVTHIAGIRFRPGGAYPFLDVSAEELTGRVLTLDEVLGSSCDHVLNDVSAAQTPEEMFAALQRFLVGRLRYEVAGGGTLIAHAVRHLEGLGPSASIVKLAADLGISHRHLLREFDRRVGLKPKMLQRILRFQRVIQLEDSRPALDWTRAAVSCGYYDQAHLIRDFKTFSAVTPELYRRTRLDYPNYVPELA